MGIQVMNELCKRAEKEFSEIFLPIFSGELFTTVIVDQFTRIRDSDRFWFENEDNG